MIKKQNNQSVQHSWGVILYRTICVLLVLTVVTSWSVSGVYAKYIVGAEASDSANVLGMGIETLEVWEYKPVKLTTPSDMSDGMLYKLDKSTKITSGTQEYIVLPGVDIHKEVYVKVQLNTKLSYELYLMVTVSASFPTNKDLVTYKIDTDNWEKDTKQTGLAAGATLYKYKGGTLTDAVDEDNISVLKDKLLTVSQNFSTEGTHNAQTFTITINVYLRQVVPQ